MTIKGERGLLSQLYVDHESIQYVNEKKDSFVGELERALSDYSRNPPRVSLDVRWDSKRHLWTSELREEARVFTLDRASYGRPSTPAEQREYTVAGWGTSVGSVGEIAKFIDERLGVHDFYLEIRDPVSSPGNTSRIGFGKHAEVEKEIDEG